MFVVLFVQIQKKKTPENRESDGRQRWQKATADIDGRQ
jgi:hypothetical protein